jgi:large subunit ribosomal protein L3
MALGLLGEKICMSQVFDEDGRSIPVTILKMGPCIVVQKKTPKKDGYSAVQLGYGKAKRPNRPLKGHFKGIGLAPSRNLKEFRVEDVDEFEVGQEIKVDIFQPGEDVDITGVSKGKGFAGGVKRWGYKGGRASHGSMFHRAPGSIGASSDPSRVFKGKRLPGRMGNEKTTIKGVKIVKVDPEENILVVKGPVCGPRGGLIIVKKVS